jgi:O-antigen ligase
MNNPLRITALIAVAIGLMFALFLFGWAWAYAIAEWNPPVVHPPLVVLLTLIVILICTFTASACYVADN